MAKAKTKAAAGRKVVKAPARAAKAPKKAAPAKPVKATAAKTLATKTLATKTVATKVAATKTVASKTIKKVEAPVAPRKTGPLTLPAAKTAAAPLAAATVAKPAVAPPVRKVIDTGAPRADLPPPDGFTLLVDGHFKSCFGDLKGAKAAASELKGRFPMLRVEIYDAAKKARLPA